MIVEGSISADEAAASIKERQGDPEASNLARLVLVSDRTAAMTEREIDDLAQAVNDLSSADGSPCAIVTFTDVHFGQSRMYLSYRNKPADKLKVFRDIKDALNWLGVDSNPAIMEFEMAIALS